MYVCMYLIRSIELLRTQRFYMKNTYKLFSAKVLSIQNYSLIQKNY